MMELRQQIASLDLSKPADRKKQKEVNAEIVRAMEELIEATDEILRRAREGEPF
jgi:hypothetical protein